MNELISPQSELAELARDAVEISQRTKSEATKRAYQSDLKIFKAWCSSVKLSSLPAEPETVALYVVHLDKQGRKPSTIRRAMTSISQAHLLGGCESPVTARVLEIKKGVHRIRGTAQVQKKALTLDRLRRCIESTPPSFLGARDKAVLLVGWAGALRRSEICNIDVEDLEEEEAGLAVKIRYSKTDQEGEGRVIGLPFIDSDERLCPVRALQHWLKLSGIASGPCFLGIGKGGSLFFGDINCARLNDRRVAYIVKAACKRAGYNPANFAGHSLRSGLATTLARAGIDERRIANITGHKSMKMLRTYIQDGQLFRDHPILRLF